MDHREGKRVIFNPRGLLEFLLFCLVLGLLVAFNAKTIGFVLTLLSLAFLVVSSIMLLWRAWKHPAEFKRRGMNQAAVLPRRWGKWMLGEDDKDGSR